MKLMKTLIIAALCAGSLLVGDTMLRAQESTNTPPAGGPPGAGMRGRGQNFDQLTKQLELTEDQKPKVKAILDDQQQKMRALRNDPSFSSLSPEDKRAKNKTIRDEATAKLKDILTPEQFAKYQKMAPGQRNRPAAPAAPTTNAPAATP